MRIGNIELSDDLELKSEFIVKLFLIQNPDFHDKKYSTLFAIENEYENIYKFYYHILDIAYSYLVNDITHFNLPNDKNINSDNIDMNLINQFLIKKLDELKLKVDEYENFKNGLKNISDNQND